MVDMELAACIIKAEAQFLTFQKQEVRKAVRSDPWLAHCHSRKKKLGGAKAWPGFVQED